MPTTQSGWEKKITAYAVDQLIPLSRGQVKRMALKIHKRAEHMQAELTFEQALRILGIHSDPTARDAVRNLERQAA